jgi:hypothetical protein
MNLAGLAVHLAGAVVVDSLLTPLRKSLLRIGSPGSPEIRQPSWRSSPPLSALPLRDYSGVAAGADRAVRGLRDDMAIRHWSRRVSPRRGPPVNEISVAVASVRDALSLCGGDGQNGDSEICDGLFHVDHATPCGRLVGFIWP